MGIFGKKNEEEIEDEDSLTPDEEAKDRKLTRKFKDLTPENKKKRKEPPKPWGKKERIIVLIALISTVLISGILTLSADGISTRGFPKFSFTFDKIEFDKFNILKEETIEIRKK